MQIVIPMAGEGQRFLKAGYIEPKPLITVDGKAMIHHVTNLFPGERNILYVCNIDHIQHTNMWQKLRTIHPTASIVCIPYMKKGPAYGLMQAQKHLLNDSPTLVNYCDFNMYWDYYHFKRFVEQENLDGCIVCYKGFHPHLLGNNFYASVRTDDNDTFLEIKEKYSFTENKMDSWQSCGTYYFKSGEIMKKYFQELIDKDIKCNDEHYVSLVYNLMHRDGLKIKVYPIEYFCQWGTPEDLAAYNYWSEIFTKI